MYVVIVGQCNMDPRDKFFMFVTSVFLFLIPLCIFMILTGCVGWS